MVADPTICLDNRRQSAYPGLEKHADDPCSTHHNDTGSTVGGTPVRATVLPFCPTTARGGEGSCRNSLGLIVSIIYFLGVFL
jgi:hypothetical protein